MKYSNYHIKFPYFIGFIAKFWSVDIPTFFKCKSTNLDVFFSIISTSTLINKDSSSFDIFYLYKY